MNCDCNKLSRKDSKDIESFKKSYLIELKVDGYKWVTLYKCKYCNSFWEEHYTEGRWNGDPYLIKVANEVVANNWGFEYLK